MRPWMNLRPPARQRGWVGLVMILVALAIVAFLAKDALKGYGLASRTAAPTKAGTPAERARAPGAGGVDALDLGSAPAAPASAPERARAVEDMVKQQADERASRLDAAAK
jgi:hypothetical protein